MRNDPLAEQAPPTGDAAGPRMALARLYRVLRHSAVVARDFLPVAAVGALGLATVAADPGPDPRWLSVLVVTIPLLPTLVRHRWPVAAFTASVACTLAAFLALGFTGELLGFPVLVVLLCLVRVVEHAPDRVVLAAVAVTTLLMAATLLIPADDRERAAVVAVALAVAAIARGRQRRARLALLAGLRERAEAAEAAQQRLARDAVAQERRRIAREVHDIVSHNISVMTTLADGAAVALRSSEEHQAAREVVQTIATTGRGAMHEMHALLGVLREPEELETTDHPPAPGLDHLPALVERVRRAGLHVTLTVQGRPRPVGGGTSLTAYRLVQESLSNTLRHAQGATTAAIHLRWAADQLTITVLDDGRPTTAPDQAGPQGAERLEHPGPPGPPGPPGRPGRGLGLIGMRERVTAHGGRVHAAPGPEAGWLVQARLPLSTPYAGGTP